MLNECQSHECTLNITWDFWVKHTNTFLSHLCQALRLIPLSTHSPVLIIHTCNHMALEQYINTLIAGWISLFNLSRRVTITWIYLLDYFPFIFCRLLNFHCIFIDRWCIATVSCNCVLTWTKPDALGFINKCVWKILSLLPHALCYLQCLSYFWGH